MAALAVGEKRLDPILKRFPGKPYQALTPRADTDGMTSRLNRRFLAVVVAAAASAALLLSVATPSAVSAATATTKLAAAKGSAQGDQAGQPGPGQGGRQRGGFFGGGSLDAAAQALGMTTEALTKELTAGKSIADVATAKKISVDTVVNAIQAAMRPSIVEMVNTKGLTVRGPGGPGGGTDRQGAPGAATGQGATGEALKACLKGKGIDPAKVPTDQAGKDARAKALKECIKAGASS